MKHSLAVRSGSALLLATAILPAQWLQQSPATSPTARSGAGMTYSPVNNGLLLFGGGSPGLNGQTWVYDGLDWTQQAPVTSPSARFGHQLVFDSTRGVAVLYGGLASAISIPPPNNDTWEWNGTDWALVTVPTNPGPRYRYAMCFDPVRARTVLFGGVTTQLLAPPTNQTWEYDGTTWTQVTTAGSPGPRDRASMCFHAGIGKAVLFGGYNGTAFTNQTWTYDGATWTQASLAGPLPAARSSAAMCYDPIRGVCVLMGGQDASGVMADTWLFDGTAWIAQTGTTQAGRDHMLAFLPNTNQSVRFGGFVAAPNTLSNQTWELGTGAFGRGCTGTNGVPTLTALSAPQVGQPWSVNAGNLEPTFSLAFLVFGFQPLPGVDLGPLLGMTGCFAYCSADLLLSIPGSSGTAGFTWNPVSGPIGGTFFCQALCLDPTANAFGFTLSNAIFATID
ncbi:MAG: hypothetical protein JNK15_15520 [Planctomycetes bacterium]|nr:hypothetical protein [Planctomycetota bacterium]